MKTIFTFKNGKTRVMGQRYAEVLGKLVKGTYETRELRASVPSEEADARAADAYIKARNAEIAAEQAQESEPEVEADELDGLSVEELRELAEQRGVNVHHRAGADKIRAALRGDGDE